MPSRYRLFSADSHLEISPQRWTGRAPAKYRDRAPRLVKLSNGGDGVVVEGRPLYVLGLAIAGKPYEPHELSGLNYEGSEGAGTPEQRLQEQDQDGVDGEILYASASNLTFLARRQERRGLSCSGARLQRFSRRGVLRGKS